MVRLTFSKTGRARFISHLDLMKVFQRAFYRAELPLKYSQGFNPHAYVSIALPLSVGQAGLCEQLDMGVSGPVDTQALPELLNGLLPEGIAVLTAAYGGFPIKDIVWARYDMEFETDAAPETFLQMFAAPLIVEKRTKKGSAPTDLLPMIKSYSCAAVDAESGASRGLRAVMELAAQNPTLNPDYITAAFARTLGEDVSASIARTAFLDAAGAIL